MLLSFLYTFLRTKPYLNWSIAFQFHDTDCVIRPLSVLVKLNITSETINSHLHENDMTEKENHF